MNDIFYFPGVLSLRKKTVKDAMTWLPDVYMLDTDRKTDTELLLDLHKHGYSRIPVYTTEKFVFSFVSNDIFF
jgi:metal transporter CNNM